MAAVARILISVDNRGALVAVRQTAAEVDAASGQMVAADERTAVANAETTASFESMRRGVMLVGTVALGALAFGLDKSVKAAMAFQTQQKGLQVALRNTGLYSAATMKQLNDEAAKLSTHGGFSVSAQLPALTQLVSATHSATSAIQLNRAATNLARGAHIDYAAAVKMVQGAEVGRARGLEKLIGITIPVTKYTYGWTAALKAADPAGYAHAATLNRMATAQEILGRVTKTYGDQAAAYSNTTAGHLSNLQNAFEILSVKVGTAFLPIVDKVARVLSTVGAWMTAHMNTVKELGKQLFLVGGFIYAIVLATRAWILVTKLLTLAADMNPYLLAVTAIALIILEIATHWKEVKRWAGDAWNSIASALKPVWSMIKDVYTWMKWLVDHVGNLFSGASGASRWSGSVAPTSTGVSLHGGQTPRSLGSSSSLPNPVPATKHRAGVDTNQAIVLHHTTTLNGRVLAEEVVQYSLKHTSFG